MVKQKLFGCLVLCCGLLCIAGFSHAQPVAEKGQPFIANFNPRALDYYPQNWSCAEDKRGLNFGNVGYILQYDGASRRKIHLPGSSQAVARSLLKDHEGRIFYGGMDDLGYLASDSSGNTKCVSVTQYIPASQRNFHDAWTIYEILFLL